MVSSAEVLDEISKTAQEEFNKGCYQECLACLNDLTAAVGGDPHWHVTFNKCLCQINLMSADEMFRYRDRMFTYTVESTLPQFGLPTRLPTPDQEAISVLSYNVACLDCWMGDLSRCVYPLEDLIEDAYVGREATFLLAEVYTVMCKPRKALKWLSRLESSFLKKDGSLESSDVAAKRRWLLAKLRCYNMCRDSRVAKKCLKALPAESQDVQCGFLKAHHEYLKLNYVKAVRCLSQTISTNSSSETGLSGIIDNAFGCIYSQLQKPQIGQHLFRSALNKFTSQWGPGCITTFSGDTLVMSSIMNNLGVSALRCGSYQLAFDCFLKLVGTCSRNPRIWLRLAECCIAIDAQKQGHQVDGCVPLLSRIVGHGPHKKIVLNSSNGDTQKRSTAPTNGLTPLPTLTFASMCLTNALIHLPVVEKDHLNDANSPDSPGLACPAPPGNTLSLEEIKRLRCLCAMAYVKLSCEEYGAAYEFAQELLKQSNLSPIHRFLGNLYRAEALANLDRLLEAIEVITEIESTVNSESADRLNTGTEAERAAEQTTVTSWKATMTYNQAVTYCLLGDFNRAAEKISQVCSGADQCPPHWLSLTIFVQLRAGQFDNARQLVSKNFPLLRTTM